MKFEAGPVEFPELDSTNQEALRRLAAGEAGPLWLRADRQSAGRGRRGRAWDSGEGNLLATLMLRPERPQAEWAQLSFVAAIATADMAADYAPGIAVKWPNDVLAEGRKLAGILLETAGEGLAIGIGVNLKSHPEDTEFPAISLAGLGLPQPSPQRALASLSEHLAAWYDIWVAQGFAPVRDAWLARAAHLGQPIRARLPEGEYDGIFEGIDGTGAMLLNQGSTTRAIAAGEVFFG